MLHKKAQGTIEYLVIIAIVVVIALVVVGLLLQIMGQGSGIPEQTARTAWKSTAPFAVTDWLKSGSSLQLVLKNNSYEALNFSVFTLNSSDTNGLDMNNIAPGATYTVRIATTQACASSGSKYSYPKENITIGYSTSTITSERTQTAPADITGTCS